MLLQTAGRTCKCDAAIGRDQDVGCLQVAVDAAAGMHVAQPTRNLPHHRRHSVPVGQALPSEITPQIAATA